MTTDFPVYVNFTNTNNGFTGGTWNMVKYKCGLYVFMDEGVSKRLSHTVI